VVLLRCCGACVVHLPTIPVAIFAAPSRFSETRRQPLFTRSITISTPQPCYSFASTLSRRSLNMAFGDFDTICKATSVPLCALVGPPGLSGSTGIQADCYSRNIEVANTIIFQGAADFMHIIALIMTVIMIIHVRSKFTAVGKSGSAKGLRFATAD
jgi:Chitin synthase export chaperone